jgi:hypothetical protein
MEKLKASCWRLCRETRCPGAGPFGVITMPPPPMPPPTASPRSPVLRGTTYCKTTRWYRT